MRVIATAPFVLLPLFLIGCASPRQAPARFDFAKKQCVSQLQTLPVNAVPRVTEEKKNAQLKIDFQKAASCINAKDGRPVPILLLGLDGKVPSEVNVSIAIRNEAAFASALDLLDSEFGLVRTVPFADFTKRGGSYTLSVFLNDSDQNVRYLAMRPDRGTVGKTDDSIVGMRNETFIAAVAGSTLYYGNFVTGSEVVARTWHSEVGLLQVVLKDYQPTQIKPR
jgi:hypothetical protein